MKLIQRFPYAPVYLGQSDDYTLTQSDIGSWVTVGFSDPLGVYTEPLI